MATFSELYLRRVIDDLRFDRDIEPFFGARIPEGETLEYKSGGGDLADHGDVIASFLNTSGGLLIVGTPQEATITLPNGKRQKICEGDFHPVPLTAKEDALRKLIGKIEPLPSGVRVQPVQCPEGCVLVVEVAQSQYPPHQFDHAYWVRLDGETRRAPHGFVEALFLRRRGPILACRVIVDRLRRVPSNHGNVDAFDIALSVVVTNDSPSVGEFVAVDAKFDARLTPAAGYEDIQVADPQDGDVIISTVRDTTGQYLMRYRLRHDVLHAYEWKRLLCVFRADIPSHEQYVVDLVVELQAKDMLRRRYEFTLDLCGQGGGSDLRPAQVRIRDGFV
jgi:hypothetical protein